MNPVPELKPGDACTYYPMSRFGERPPVPAVVLRKDRRDGWLVVQADGYQNPVVVRVTSLRQRDT